jgi:phosphoglycolate phosphatase-like HAD superfamily hydrolase
MKSSPDADIRLILADVDGTLVTQEKVLTERARKAVHALHAKTSSSPSPAAGRPRA